MRPLAETDPLFALWWHLYTTRTVPRAWLSRHAPDGTLREAWRGSTDAAAMVQLIRWDRDDEDGGGYYETTRCAVESAAATGGSSADAVRALAPPPGLSSIMSAVARRDPFVDLAYRIMVRVREWSISRWLATRSAPAGVDVTARELLAACWQSNRPHPMVMVLGCANLPDLAPCELLRRCAYAAPLACLLADMDGVTFDQLADALADNANTELSSRIAADIRAVYPEPPTEQQFSDGMRAWQR